MAKTQPIGLFKRSQRRFLLNAKSASGAIGAPAPAKSNPKAPAESQVAPKESDPSITPDSALQYLEQSEATETFGEYQVRSKGQAVQAKTQTPTEQNTSYTEVDQDDTDLQRALQESRQQAQMEGSDPAASSSTSAQLSTQDALQAELQTSHELQRESDHLEQKMVGSGLTQDELERFRKVSQLLHTNKLRVAELIERKAQENQSQQSQSTHTLLGSLQPLQPLRLTQPRTQQSASALSKAQPIAMPPTPITKVKAPPIVIGQKAKPPQLSKSFPPVKELPVFPSGKAPASSQESTQAPPPLSSSASRMSGGVAADSAQSPKQKEKLLQGQQVSPRGRPPPRIADPQQLAFVVLPSGVEGTAHTPRSEGPAIVRQS